MKKLISAVLVFAVTMSLFGCQQEKTITKPDIEMKNEIQNSNQDYVSFYLDVPTDWTCGSPSYTGLRCISSDKSYENKTSEISPCMLQIENYITPALMPVDDKYKRAYNDMFNKSYDGIEQIINDNIEYINAGLVIDSFPEKEFNSSESIMDYFNLLIDEKDNSTVKSPDGWDDIVWAKDFTYNEYSAKNAKILAVEYTFTLIDKEFKAINCYRDDNYCVSGMFDDSTKPSSGDIALWVASTLEVKEHYRYENNKLLQEGVDY